MGITISYTDGWPFYNEKMPKVYGKPIDSAISYRFRIMLRIGKRIFNFYF